MRCYWKLLRIFYQDPDTNDDIRRNIQAVIAQFCVLLTMVTEEGKPISQSFDLAKTMLQGTVKGKGKRDERKRWEDFVVVVVVVLLFYVHGKHLRSCRDDQLT